MSDDRPTRDTMSIEEATVSNMWEIAAIVEVLERKGLCTMQDLYDIITEFRRKNPRASIPETAFPEPYLLTEIENKIIDDMLELLNKHGLTSHQSMNLLERLGRIIEMGHRVAKCMTALAILHLYRACDLLSVPFSRSFQRTDISRGEEVRNKFRKIKKNIHKPLSPASVDKSVHKFAPPSKYSTFLYLHEVNA